VDTKYQVQRINQLIRGWVNYFKVGHMKKLLTQIDSHTRVRLRMCIWHKWKTAKNRRKNLIKLGMNKYNAYKNSHTSKGAIRIAYSWILTTTITNARLSRFGLISCIEHYNKVHVYNKIKPPYTDPYVRWCERSGVNYSLLLDVRKMRGGKKDAGNITVL